ncbi:hypothetical protein EJD97_010092 [Solanum chilense]|uniref:Uncharacterized protein n=1 Tax=Solanum chilense TaxID=4083 RepID=A0A6N2CGJ4_SOLCI|nr:hypothetical protein EJD97_010092 [Solanum chilense]
MNPLGFRPAPVEILDNEKINIEPATPISTLKNVIKCSKSDLSFSKDELRKAEEQIRMSLLSFINTVAKLIEILESTFIKHFVNGNQRKGMKFLRRQAKKDTHRVGFFMDKNTFLLVSSSSSSIIGDKMYCITFLRHLD